VTFFNKKEDVLDIKLTRYGRDQLSKGKLKPTYYAFFDDDILYDSAYAGFTEDQNSTESRIQEDTVALRTQPNHEGAEFSISTLDSGQRTGDKHYSLAFPLGDSAITSDRNPAWNLKFLKNEISSSAVHLTGSHQIMKIPQINVEVKYKTMVRSIDDPISNSDTDGSIYTADASTLVSKVFPDGTYIEVVQDPVLIEIIEENTEFELENVSIELYEIERVDVSGSIKNLGAATDDVTKKIVYRPLVFQKKFSNIKNGLLVPDIEFETNNVPIDSNYAEYYLDILVDREVPEQVICEGVQTLKAKQINISDFLDEYDCEKYNANKASSQMDVYGSTSVDTTSAGDDMADCEEDENCP
jgi:hypothetical protein